MSEHQGGSGRNHGEEPGSERRAAHERLSTGALARWMRACATHPWRVVLGWVGIVVAADRPRRDRRRQPEGRVRDPGLGHAEGDRPDRVRVRGGAGRRPEPRLRRARRASGSTRPSARRRSRTAIAQAQDRRVRADRGRGRDRERRRPVQRGHVLGRRAHRLRGGPVRPGHLRGGPRGRRRRAGRRPRDGRAGRRDGRVQRRRRVPADRAGDAGAARPARGADRAARRLPHVRRDDRSRSRSR